MSAHKKSYWAIEKEQLPEKRYEQYKEYPAWTCYQMSSKEELETAEKEFAILGESQISAKGNQVRGTGWRLSSTVNLRRGQNGTVQEDMAAFTQSVFRRKAGWVE